MKPIAKSSVFILSILFSGFFSPTPAAADCSLSLNHLGVENALIQIPKRINAEEMGPRFTFEWDQYGEHCFETRILHEQERVDDPPPVPIPPQSLGRRLLLAPRQTSDRTVISTPTLRYGSQYELECMLPSDHVGNAQSFLEWQHGEIYGDPNDEWDDQYGLVYSDHDEEGSFNVLSDGSIRASRPLPLSEWGRQYVAGEERLWKIPDVAPLRICGFERDVYLHDVPFLSFAAGTAREGIPSFAEAFIYHEDEEGNNLGTLERIQWASWTGRNGVGREILSSAPVDAQGNPLPCDPAEPGFMQVHRVGGCNGGSMGASGIVEVLQRRFAENGGCPPGTTCKVFQRYYFNHVRHEAGQTPENILSNWLGRINQIHTFTIAEAGGTIRTARVKTCSVFEGDPLQACGLTGLFEVDDPVRIWGPLWGLSNFPEPEHIKKAEIKIDPDYKKDQQDNAKYTPQMNNVSPLDKVRVSVEAPSFRARELYHTKVKLMIKNEEGVEATVNLAQDSYPLQLVWKDGQLMNPSQEMTSEVDQWFKNHGDKDYTFETPQIDLRADWRLILAAEENLPVFFRVYREQHVIEQARTTPEGTQTIERVTVPEKILKDIPLELTNCARVYGQGKHGVSVTGGESTEFNVPQLLSRSREYREQFLDTEPYKAKKDEFSFFVDLRAANDWDSFNNVTVGGVTDSFKKADVSCDNSNGVVLRALVVNFPEELWRGVANLEGDFLIQRDTAFATTFVHESGHAFAGLYDEAERAQTPVFEEKNCASRGEDLNAYSFDGLFYGDPERDERGCGRQFYPAVQRVLGRFLIPSKNSLMNYSPNHSDSFNVVSCGYIMERIMYDMDVRATANSYFPECARLLNFTPVPVPPR